MTNDELKKKIVEILCKVWIEPVPCTAERKFEHVTDALIAAGIGDLKEHRIFAGKDGSIKQLYSGEEVEKIVKERKELKDELRSKVEYIHEQDEVIKEYKHRAARAERALMTVCTNVVKDEEDDLAIEPRVRVLYKAYLKQAKKELAEEGKDEQN